VDLHFLREQRRAIIENNKELLKKSIEWKKTELAISRLSDITFVVSSFEKELLLNEDPNLSLEVISNIHEVKGCRVPFNVRKDILFLGGFSHPPNVDAVLWFVRDIFPLIKKMNKNIQFYIVGSNPPKEVLTLASDDVIVTGYVEDIEPYLDNCRVFVAPLRYGAGVKGKINMSMSYGLPVVTTTIGAEGMDLEDGVNTLIADDPDQFAEKIIILYQDECLWEQLSARSIINVKNNFSFENMEKKLKEVILKL
jgi:glycosyltransferase involved in cell wall biosynthesis